MPSFDVVSKIAMHEVDNALQQATKEVGTRYDFRDTGTVLERADEGIVIRSDAEARVAAAYSVLQEKLAKRGVPLQSLAPQQTQAAGGGTYRRVVKLIQGIDRDQARELVAAIKESKLKVQAAIQGDAVRVTGKKRDDLQACIAALRARDFGLPLQFENFRD